MNASGERRAHGEVKGRRAEWPPVMQRPAKRGESGGPWGKTMGIQRNSGRVVSRPPGKVRPAHRIDDAEAGDAFGLGPEVGAILSALQGRDRRGAWLWGRYSEIHDHTAEGFRGALQRAAADAYLECLPGAAVAMLPAMNTDGSCACALGARCFMPGAHPRRNAQGDVLLARWAGDVGVMPWEAVRGDLALRTGRESDMVAVTAERDASVPSWLGATLAATSARGERLFLYARGDYPVVPSASLGTGVRLYGDDTFLRVPPGFAPSTVPIGWDTPDGSPADVCRLPKRALLVAGHRAARGLR